MQTFDSFKQFFDHHRRRMGEVIRELEPNLSDEEVEAKLKVEWKTSIQHYIKDGSLPPGARDWPYPW